MSIRDVIEKILTGSVKFIFLLIILYLTVVVVLYSCKVDIYETTYYDKDSIAKNICCIGLMLMICIGVAIIKIEIPNKLKKIRPKRLKKIVSVIILCWTIFSLVWILSTQLLPRADQYYVLDAAKGILSGNLQSFEKGGYMYIYPAQSGIVLFFTFLGVIFGKYNYVSIQVLNLFAILVSYYYIYKSYKITYNYTKKEKIIEQTAIVVGLFMFIQIIFYTTFVYGNIFGLMFSVIAVYFELSYLKNEKIYKIILSFICIILASLIKMNYLVTMIAMIILLLYEVIFKKNYRYFFLIILLPLMYCLGNSLVKVSMEKITNKELTGGVPKLSYIVMGLQEGGYASGWYNGYNVKVFIENEYNTKKAEVQVKEDLRNILSEFKKDGKNLKTYINEKIVSQWANPTFQCFWVNQNRQTYVDVPEWADAIVREEGMYDILVEYMDVLQTLIFFGTFMYFVIEFRKIKFENLIFAIIFIGGFLFHIIWEAKCQYTMTYFVLIIPYAVKGYSTIISGFNKILQK